MITNEPPADTPSGAEADPTEPQPAHLEVDETASSTNWAQRRLSESSKWILDGHQGPDSAKQVTLAQYQVLTNIVGIVLGVVTIVVATIGVIVAIQKVDGLKSSVEQTKLIIVSPKDGEAVGLGQRVNGHSPFLKLNHYILVTCVRTGDVEIQPAFVRPDGTFTGQARFGDQGCGRDDEFNIQVFATKSAALPDAVPNGAPRSNVVKVRRAQPEAGIVITSPTKDTGVTMNEEIHGRTALTDLKHYIVVTPLRTGTAVVQDARASVDRSTSTFSGRARFGDNQTSVGEPFSVRVLATKSTLPPGALMSEEGTVPSNTVTVKRKN